MESGFKYRDAIRLLFILHGCARPRSADSTDDPKVIGVFEGEKRLMAIDFWIRYPDYLANHLLDLYEDTKDQDLLAKIEAIFELDEPDVRLVKVLRWKYGAFDRIEDALAVLSARDLVKPVKRRLPNGNFQHDFLVLAAATEFLTQAVRDQPALQWYQDRTQLALVLAQSKSGSSLKEIQYGEPEYEKAVWSTVIPSIKDRVGQRLQEVKAAQ